VFLPIVIVSVDVDEVGLGAKLALLCGGATLADSVTFPVKPPAGVTVIVSVAVELCETVAEDGEAESENVPAGAVFTVCVSTFEVAPLKFGSPPYVALMECVPAASADVASFA